MQTPKMMKNQNENCPSSSTSSMSGPTTSRSTSRTFDFYPSPTHSSLLYLFYYDRIPSFLATPSRGRIFPSTSVPRTPTTSFFGTTFKTPNSSKSAFPFQTPLAIFPRCILISSTLILIYRRRKLTMNRSPFCIMLEFLLKNCPPGVYLRPNS